MPHPPQNSAPYTGDLVAGRYLIGAKLPSDLVSLTPFEATDQVLARPVRLNLLTGPHALAALDAARRAALVADPRLARVLDAGLALDGHSPYVVTEPYPGITLTDAVSAGIVNSTIARSIIGEAAEVLSLAWDRGVTHLALRPDSIRISGSNVVVTGLGFDAALAGIESSAASQLQDTVSLAALGYYALTARWTGDSLERLGIAPSALRPLAAVTDSSGAPPPLGRLLRQVDSVFDDVVSKCLAGKGARTPGELAASLRPWEPVTLLDPLAAASITPSPPPEGPPRRDSVRIARPAVLPSQSLPPAIAPSAPNLPGQLPQPVATAPLARSAVPIPTGSGHAARVPTSSGTTRPATTRSVPVNGVPATPIVMGILLLVVVLAGVWARGNLFTPTEPGDAPPIAATPNAPEQTSGTGQPGPNASPTPTPEVRPIIAEVVQVGPPAACSGEQPEQAANVMDGDPTTFWHTCTYNQANWGGGDANGLAVILREPAPVHSVTIYTNSAGGHVEVRATTLGAPTEGAVLASGPFASVTQLVFAEPITADSFVIWITELPPSGDRFRLELTEIALQ